MTCTGGVCGGAAGEDENAEVGAEGVGQDGLEKGVGGGGWDANE